MKTVIGVFTNRTDAEDVITRLQADGYNPKNMSIVMKNSEEARALADNTGAVIGALDGVLTNLGLYQDEARIYEDRIKEGGILLAVPASADMAMEVTDILEDYGADQVKTISAAEESTRNRSMTDERPAAYFSKVSRKR